MIFRLRAQLSTSGPPLRLEVEDGRIRARKALTLVAVIRTGTNTEENPLVSRRIPLLIQPGGRASIRLDHLLSQLVGNNTTDSEKVSAPLAERWILGRAAANEVFNVVIHFTLSRTHNANLPYRLSTVTLRAEGVDFPFARELLCLHSEFFCALLYGQFAESGKDLVKLDTFTYEEIEILHRVIQLQLPVETGTEMMALAVADRVLFSLLKAYMLSLPIPTNNAQKARWLVSADKYNNVDLAKRIVETIPVKDANAVHLQLYNMIANGEVGRLLLQRAIGTFIDVEIENKGVVRIRLYTDEMPYETAQLLKVLPASTKWRKNQGFETREIELATGTSKHQKHVNWALCSLPSGSSSYNYNGQSDRTGLHLIKDPSRGYYYGNYNVLGEVVDGVEILDDAINWIVEMTCTITITQSLIDMFD